MPKPIAVLVLALRALVDRQRQVRTRALKAVTRTVVEMLVPTERKKPSRTLSAQEISGWAWKRGGTGWQKRWLHLSGNVLSWSLKATSLSKGAMLLRGCTIAPTTNGRAEFVITPNDYAATTKTYSFRCSNVTEQAQWVGVLQIACLVGTSKAIILEATPREAVVALEKRISVFYTKYNPASGAL